MIKEKKIDEIEIEDFKSRIKKEGIAGFENHTNEEIATIINESNKFISNIEKELKKEDESDLCHKAFLDAKNYTVEKYESELIKIIESGVFVGYETFDTHFKLPIGELTTIEAQSNHGKTAFKINLMCSILQSKKNAKANPMCFYLNYESYRTNIFTRIINILRKDKLIEFKPVLSSKEIDAISNKEAKQISSYYVNNLKEYQKHQETINKWIKDNSLIIPEKSFNVIDVIKEIKYYKEKYPDRTQVYFFDYVQIIKHSFEGDNWLIKGKIAALLARTAEKYGVIIVTGSQLNEKGDTAESKAIYNESSISMRVFNHSQSKVKDQDPPKYVAPVNGEMNMTIALSKTRGFGTKAWTKEFYLVKGDYIAHKPNAITNLNPINTTPLTSNKKTKNSDRKNISNMP